MKSSLLLVPVVVAAVATASRPATQGVAATGEDTVVIRVTSARAAETRFRGVIMTSDSMPARRIVGTRTPFEIRIPAHGVHALFSADDGGSLAGEIVGCGAATPQRAAGMEAGIIMMFCGRDEVGFAGLQVGATRTFK